jgi:hypothetical protein
LSSTSEPAVSASSASSAIAFSASSLGALGPDTDEDDPLQPELAVLDLGDVLELGAQADDAAQCVAGRQVGSTDRVVELGVLCRRTP